MTIDWIILLGVSILLVVKLEFDDKENVACGIEESGVCMLAINSVSEVELLSDANEAVEGWIIEFRLTVEERRIIEEFNDGVELWTSSKELKLESVIGEL